MITIEIDVALDTKIGPLLESLEKHNGKLGSFIAIGPAGGNPCMQFSFPDRAKAKEFLLSEYCPDDSATADYLMGFATEG